jgi:hypothetical protein
MSMRNFEMTSRQDVGRGRFDHPAGSRGAGTQYSPAPKTYFLFLRDL